MVVRWSEFSHESILEKGNHKNVCDSKYILGIQKQFGRVKVKELKFMTLWERYIGRHSRKKVKHIRPLNYLNYNVANAIKELEDFCGFQYYGGKHYESILTRFMQCYYLPEIFGMDKCRSHFSSLIMAGQMAGEEALKELDNPLYDDKTVLTKDKEFLADYMGITIAELERGIHSC